MSAQKWDDEFDFEDYDITPKKKIPNQHKKITKNNDDFFQEDTHTNKPPNIPQKQIPPKQSDKFKRLPDKQKYPQNNSHSYNNNAYQDENIDQLIQISPTKKTKNTDQWIKKKQQPIYDDDIAQTPFNQSKKQPNKKSIIKTEEFYKSNGSKNSADEPSKEISFQDVYENDFQQVEIEQQVPQKKIQQQGKNFKKTKPIANSTAPKTQNSNQTTNPFQKKDSHNPTQNLPKPPSRASQPSTKYQPKRHLTVDKTPTKKHMNIPRSNSRQSFKSVGSRQGSISIVETSRFKSQIQRSLPQINLNDLTEDKLHKLNQRVRTMIKKFNQQLNGMVNKSIHNLKLKKNEKLPNIQNQLKIWQQKKNTNNKRIEFIQKQFNKLNGRDGQLRQQQYQLMIQKNIDKLKQSIKQKHKTIQKFKIQIKSDGNKLTENHQNKKLHTELNHIKTILFQAKKDQQKYLQSINKYNQQITELQQKIQQINEHSKNSQFIQIQKKQSLVRKYYQKKKNLQYARNNQALANTFWSNKLATFNKDKHSLKTNLTNCELQLKNITHDMQHSKRQTKKLIQKQKQKHKSNPKLIQSLQQILLKIQQQNYSQKSDDNRSHSSQHQIQNHYIKINKLQSQKRSQSANNDKYFNMPELENKNKPILLKKSKNKATSEKNTYQQPQPHQQPPKQQIQKPKQQQKDHKKPFTLKKNRLGFQHKIPQDQPQSINDQHYQHQQLKLKSDNPPKKQQQPQKSQTVQIAPKMFKFKRRGNDQLANLVPRQQQKPPQIKPIQQQPPKIQQDKPIFAPKRFNLRNRQQKKQDSYIPSISNKVKQNQPSPPKNQQYKPKFNFNQVEDHYKKSPNKNIQDIKQQKIIIPKIQQKYYQDNQNQFYLKSQDKQKYLQNQHQQVQPTSNKPTTNSYNKINDIGNNNPYAPKQANLNSYSPPKENMFNLAQKKLQSQNNTLTIRQQSKNNISNDTSFNNSNNPYAQNQAGGGRMKEGPIKKPKIQASQKQKHNIYEQAEQIQGLIQVGNEPQPHQLTTGATSKQKDLNLHDLLGVKKKSNNDDLTDLLGFGVSKSKAKKNTDFFQDMEL